MATSFSDPAVMQVLHNALLCLVSESPTDETLKQATKTCNEFVFPLDFIAFVVH